MGAIQALEKVNVLPLHKHEPNEKLQVKGVAGASAGAITVLMVALGLYRGIKISKEKGLQTGYSNDCVHVDNRFDKSVRQIKSYLINETNLTEQDIDSASRKSIRELKAKMIVVGKGFNDTFQRKNILLFNYFI